MKVEELPIQTKDMQMPQKKNVLFVHRILNHVCIFHFIITESQLAGEFQMQLTTDEDMTQVYCNAAYCTDIPH
jgi:hypothetical protein